MFEIQEQKSWEMLIPEESVSSAVAALERLAKITAARGIPFSYKDLGPTDIRHKVERDFTVVIPCRIFALSEPSLGFNQYQLIAKLEHTSAGNLIQKGELTDIPDAYRTCEPNCDHCETKRNRNYSWLLLDKSTQEIKQIGSSCVSDFTYADNADEILNIFDAWHKLAAILKRYSSDMYPKDLDEEFKERAPSRYLLDLEDVVCEALAVIAKDNNTYVSRSAAWSLGRESTGDLVESQYTSTPFTRVDYLHFRPIAQRVIQWLNGSTFPERMKTTTFGHNLGVVAKRGVVDYKSLGLVAAGVGLFLQHEQEMRANHNQVSTHQGSEGEKITKLLTIQKVIPIVGYQGSEASLVIMTDDDGNKYKWRTQSQINAATAYPYLAKFTVKGHEQYKGIDQTEILRVNFIDLSLIEKLGLNPYSIDIKQFKNSISKLSDPDLPVRCYDGKKIPLPNFLYNCGFLFRPEFLEEYLKHPKLNISRVLDTGVIEEVLKDSEESEELQSLRNYLEESGLKSDSVLEPTSSLTSSPF